jgi:prepilin-type N-terminal cleavage/methylation domain-containing protein
MVKGEPQEEFPRRRAGNGFSMLELLIAMAMTAVITVLAILQLNAAMRSARSDSDLRIVLDQLRQAREYSIANRRYVAISFPIVAGQSQIVITQINSLTPGAGLVNPVLSTIPLEAPVGFLVIGSLPDTPDGFGNGAPIFFGGVSGGPAGGMLFQSDGELVDGSAFLAINGTVVLAEPNQPNSARAITVLGTTGRVRGWKSTGTGWVSF